MLWTILFAGAAWAGDCTDSVNAGEINTHMQDALMGFALMDDEAFYASTEEARDKLPCLDEVFLPPNSAAFHRLIGVRAFYDGEEDAMTDSFRAALTIEPDYVLSDKIAPEGGKLYRAYEAARTMPVRSYEPIEVDRSLVVYVNGAAERERPADVPTIVQIESEGELTWTGYVPAGEILPAHLLTAVADGRDSRSSRDDRRGSSSSRDSDAASDRGRDLARAPNPRDPKTRSGGGSDTLMWALAGGSTVVAGGLFATSAISRGSFDDEPTQGKMTLTNGAYFGSIGFGVAALGFGGAALLGGGQ